jgi:hypothetical protein
MRFSLAIVLSTRTGSSASAGTKIIPGFMSRQTHVSSPIIRSRKWHLSCAFRTLRSYRAPLGRFALKSSSRKWGTHLKCRLFILREVVRWRCTFGAGILRNSAIVGTEHHGSASKTCRIRVSISSRVGRSSIGHSDQNDVISPHVANISFCFHQMHLRGRLSLAQQRSQAVPSPCGGGSSPHTSARFSSLILNGYRKSTFLRSVLAPRCRIDVMQETWKRVHDFDNIWFDSA